MREWREQPTIGGLVALLMTMVESKVPWEKGKAVSGVCVERRGVDLKWI